MEVLTPMDHHRPHHSYSDWYQPPRRSGGLHTPQSSTSQSSHDPFDKPRTWAHDTWSARTPTSEQTNMSYRSYLPKQESTYSSRPMTQQTAAPSTKPSLPPIRSILAEPLASPPATPASSRRALQLSPQDDDREYSRGHKRGCSSLAWERRTSHTSPAGVLSGPLPPLEIPVRRDSATQPVLEPSGYRPAKDAQHRQRLSTAFLPELRTSALDGRPVSPERSGISSRPALPRKRSFDSMSAPVPSESQHIPAAWAHVHSQGSSPQVARSTYHTSPPPPSAPSYRPYSTSVGSLARSDVSEPQALAPPYSHNPDTSSTSASMYARPAGYDYQLSKARKRSNLPKESTDIMKRWFEDHLGNPYPSEDEKKYFAVKAGISLTQVSNWFINHRRRCPELREQRDKKQTSSRESNTESP